MRYKALLSFFFALVSGAAVAKWEKINDIDYTWGPFKIYNISLFSETGEYTQESRPLMLTLKYSKPVDGRDFAISVAKSWESLGITLPKQDEVIDRLRKILPDLKPDDALSYIALEDKGYFVLNDQVIDQEFDQTFNNAMLSIWLDPKVEFSQKLITKKVEGAEQEVHHSLEYPQSLEEVSIEPSKEQVSSTSELSDDVAHTEQLVDSEQLSTKLESTKAIKSIGVPGLLSPIANKSLEAKKVPEVKKEAEPAKDIVTGENKSTEPKIVPAEKIPETEKANEVKEASQSTIAKEAMATENKLKEMKEVQAEKAVEPEETAEPDKTKEVTPAQDKPSKEKEEIENPEKEIIPEMDPTPEHKLPLS